MKTIQLVKSSSRNPEGRIRFHLPDKPRNDRVLALAQSRRPCHYMGHNPVKKGAYKTSCQICGKKMWFNLSRGTCV